MKNIFTKEFWTEAFKSKEPESFFKPGYTGGGGQSNVLWTTGGYQGEKNLGGVGPVKDLWTDNQALRARGWEAYLTNETVQTIINKAAVWAIGRGLKLQCEPSVAVLNSEGIRITKSQAQKISDLIEARFSLYKESKCSMFSGMYNLSQAETKAFKNAKIGGDILVVIRYINDWVKVELIDGVHVKSPMGGTDWNPKLLQNGSRIMNGVEMNEAGEHVAYWVCEAFNTYKRIEAKSATTGLTTAYLVGGMEYRLDYSRCIPVFSGLFETIASLDRYKSATLESAEEQNKFAFQIKHGKLSTEENPFKQNIAQARSIGVNDGTIPVDMQLQQMADKVVATTNRQVVNNVKDSEVVPLGKNEAELYFKDFYTVIFDLVCASVNMPPNVAMSKYDTSFSSARASIKDWEHGLLIERYNFALSFLQPIYEFWLHTEILKNKIRLPGYLSSFYSNETFVLLAYRKARWVGDNVPHIDPLKEVMAERAKLGPLADHIPLTTVEASTEALNGGESTANIQQFANEVKNAETNGLKPVEKPGQKPVEKEDSED